VDALRFHCIFRYTRVFRVYFLHTRVFRVWWFTTQGPISRLNPVSASGLTLKHWPEANWQSFIFGNLENCFHTSQTAKTFSSFTVISLVDAREGSLEKQSTSSARVPIKYHGIVYNDKRTVHLWYVAKKGEKVGPNVYVRLLVFCGYKASLKEFVVAKTCNL